MLQATLYAVDSQAAESKHMGLVEHSSIGTGRRYCRRSLSHKL